MTGRTLKTATDDDHVGTGSAPITSVEAPTLDRLDQVYKWDDIRTITGSKRSRPLATPTPQVRATQTDMGLAAGTTKHYYRVVL